jgi:hypothetical protein
MSNLKISELPAAADLSGEELVPVVQDGETRKATVTELAVVDGEEVKISELSPAEVLSGDELLVVVQDGDTRQATVSSVLAEAQAQIDDLFATLGNGRVPAANIVFVDADGDDDTAEVGNRARPFASAQAAYDAIKDLATGTGKYLLKLGVGSFSVSLSADWNPYVQVAGIGELSLLTVNANGGGVNGLNGNSAKNVAITSDQSVTISVTANGVNGLDGADEVWDQTNYPDYYYDDPNYASPQAGGVGGNGGSVALTNCRVGTVTVSGGTGGGGGASSYNTAGGGGGSSGALTLLNCALIASVGLSGGAGGNGGDAAAEYSGCGLGGNGGGMGALILTDTVQIAGAVSVTSGAIGGNGNGYYYSGNEGGFGTIGITRCRVTLMVNHGTWQTYSGQSGSGANIIVSDSQVSISGGMDFSYNNHYVTATDSIVNFSLNYCSWWTDSQNCDLTATRCLLSGSIAGMNSASYTLTDCRLANFYMSTEDSSMNVFLHRCTGACTLFASYTGVMGTIRDCVFDSLSFGYDFCGTLDGCTVRTVYFNNSGYFNNATLRNNKLPATAVAWANGSWNNIKKIDGTNATEPGADGDSNWWNL